MSDNTPLYNSRVTKIYLEYIANTYPDLDIGEILKYAEMTKEEVEDEAHWFSQYQADRFQEAIIQKTGNSNIAREAGRYALASGALGVAKHYLLGLLNLTSLYLLISKVYSVFSRAASIKAKKIGPNCVEVISTPLPGVNEKPYQCQNRIGLLESTARLFYSKFADIDHTTCFHKGGAHCRYIIKWERNPSYLWKRIRNYAILTSIIISLVTFFFVSIKNWIFFALICIIISAIFSFISEYIEKNELIVTLETQGNLAQELLDEMNIRHNNAVLIQEIGQATSSILDIDILIETVIKSMQTHMDFDRGLVMLANNDKTKLIFKAGYGYKKEKEKFLQTMSFNLTNPNSKGAFVMAYKNNEPFLINDVAEIESNLSPKSLEFARQMEAKSIVCAPIVYENESLGILTVDNIRSKRPLTNSDLRVIMGVSSQMAISIVNAISFNKLEENEKKYRDLVENANSIILRQNINGEITFFNEFAQRFFGYPEKEVLGKNMEETIFQNSTSTLDKFDQVIEILKNDPERQFISENETILKNNKKVWIAWTYKPILDENRALTEILCIGNDVTELKKAEFDKKELTVRLQRAEKMEALGTLAGGVAHDLNNILSGIVSYPELLLMDLPSDSSLRKPITTIQKSGERAAAIVQDLLTLARRGVVTKKVIKLNDIMSDYLNSPEYENLMVHHEDIKVTLNLEENLFNITGSPIHLTKTIMNLITNAAEAIQGPGEIKIYTKNQYVDKIINAYEQVLQGDYVTLTISDTGVGISPQDMNRIFEPFYTKKTMGRSGTGLGMAVVWGTIKDHNAYIDIKSNEGEGTSFTLYFPVTRNISEETELLPSKKIFEGKGEKVLVVDDVEEQREIANKMLSKLGYSVVSVSSGEEAVEYLKNNSVDLLVLDMILEGGIDGLDTYKKILEFKSNQKAIITSGYSETERVKEAQYLGAKHYIKKPYLLEEIARLARLELDT